MVVNLKIQNSKFKIKAHGIGLVSDFIDIDFKFKFKNSIFIFLPSACRSYGLLPAGIANEMETHLFLASVLDFSIHPVVFVDVGASIGEFVITMADGHWFSLTKLINYLNII
jgi:hypothetical protein